jgi:hypothetical protein
VIGDRCAGIEIAALEQTIDDPFLRLTGIQPANDIVNQVFRRLLVPVVPFRSALFRLF